MVAFFKKNPKDTNGSNIKRVARMTTPSLYEYADVLLMQCGAAFDQFRYHDGPVQEVDACISALSEVWAELRARAND
jgi:hypothetical protein